jgi:hypothetical protein
LEKPFIDKKKRKGGGGMAQGVGPEFKPQNCKRKKKKRIIPSGRWELIKHSAEFLSSTFPKTPWTVLSSNEACEEWAKELQTFGAENRNPGRASLQFLVISSFCHMEARELSPLGDVQFWQTPDME